LQWGRGVNEAARRVDLMARIMDLEPEMLRVLGPAHSRVWVDVDLTMSQLKMMFVLHSAMGLAGENGLRVSEVARSLGVTLPTVTAVMDKLVERDLVHRAEDRLDRRQHVCRLTQNGQELVHRLMAGRRAFTNTLLEQLDADELEVFLSGMRMLLVAAERLRASPAAATPAGPNSAAPPRRKAS
jgi:DNA-binding MarR family transcriptional regulator